MLMGNTKYETQKYDLIFSEDDFEIRFYHSSLKAKVVSQRNSNGNFYKLFQFISGNNSKGEKIAMTTPVYMKNNDNTNEAVDPYYKNFAFYITLYNYNVNWRAPGGPLAPPEEGPGGHFI